MLGFNTDYHYLLERILLTGSKNINRRTDTETRRLHGEMLRADLAAGLPLVWSRKMYPRTMAAELAWTIGGSCSTTWLKKYCKIWEKFEDSPGAIENAYGYLWRHKYGRDQILESVVLIKDDPSSRQNLVMAWDPGLHGLENQGNFKNVPCPFAYQVLIQNRQLNMVVYVRSSDAFLGLPYDFGMYSLLAFAYCEMMSLIPGVVTFMLGDVHLYENQYDDAKNMIEINRERTPTSHLPTIDGWSIPDITTLPDEYVKAITDQTKDFEYFDFNPKTEVVL